VKDARKKNAQAKLARKRSKSRKEAKRTQKLKQRSQARKEEENGATEKASMKRTMFATRSVLAAVYA